MTFYARLQRGKNVQMIYKFTLEQTWVNKNRAVCTAFILHASNNFLCAGRARVNNPASSINTTNTTTDNRLPCVRHLFRTIAERKLLADGNLVMSFALRFPACSQLPLKVEMTGRAQYFNRLPVRQMLGKRACRTGAQSRLECFRV